MRRNSTCTIRTKMPFTLPYMDLCHALHGTSSVKLHDRLLEYLETNKMAPSLSHAVRRDGATTMVDGSVDAVNRVAACCRGNEKLPIDAVAYISHMLGTSLEVVGRDHPPLSHGAFADKQYLHTQWQPDGTCGYLPFTDHRDIQHIVGNDVGVHALLHEFHANATADDAYGVFDKAGDIANYLRSASGHHMLDVTDRHVAEVLDSPLGRILTSCIIAIATRGTVKDNVFNACPDGSVYCVSPECTEEHRHSVADDLETQCQAARHVFVQNLHDASLAALDTCNCLHTCER